MGFQKCIELDASSTKKYSRHLMFHLLANQKTDDENVERPVKPIELLFENNLVVGEFVKRMVNRIHVAYEQDKNVGAY
jgi:hypothetical protein